jgi:hypothetical protein
MKHPNRKFRVVVTLLLAGLLFSTVNARAADVAKYPLKLSLKKGDAHKLNYHYKIEVINEKGTALVSDDLDVDLRFEVHEIDDEGNYQLEATVTRLKCASKQSKADHDSEEPRNSKRNHSPFVDAIMDRPLVYTVASSGEFSHSVIPKGKDKLIAAINTELNKQPGDLSFVAIDFFTEMNRLNDFLYHMTFVVSPPQPVGLGDTWTVDRLDLAEKNKLTFKYTLRSRNKEGLGIGIEMSGPGGPTVSLAMTVDETTAWPKRCEWSFNDAAPKGRLKLLIESKD